VRTLRRDLACPDRFVVIKRLWARYRSQTRGRANDTCSTFFAHLQSWPKITNPKPLGAHAPPEPFPKGCPNIHARYSLSVCKPPRAHSHRFPPRCRRAVGLKKDDGAESATMVIG